MGGGLSLDGWIAVIGGAAALCSTVAFVPQIVKTWKQGGRDLSYGMLLLYLVGVLLWLGYGLLTGARAVILANAVAAVLVALTLALKWRVTRPAPARRQPRIAIDMDEVIADSLGKHLRTYNDWFDERLTPAALEGCGMEGAVPEERTAAVTALMEAPGFFRDFEVVPGSREAIRALSERYEVFIASAAMEVPSSFADKYAWLREHFPFVPPSHLVFCGDKGILDADYLIDDTPRHFAGFRGTPVLFSAPHNVRETRYLRVSGWREVERLLLSR